MVDLVHGIDGLWVVADQILGNVGLPENDGLMQRCLKQGPGLVFSVRSLVPYSVNPDLWSLTNPRLSLQSASFFLSVSNFTALRLPCSMALWMAWILAWYCGSTSRKLMASGSSTCDKFLNLCKKWNLKNRTKSDHSDAFAILEWFPNIWFLIPEQFPNIDSRTIPRI